MMPTHERVERFLYGLASDAPPPGACSALRGCWHALRGEWALAHDCVQAESNSDAWVHAALHREEGDLANAGYWYRRAGRSMAGGAARDEYLAIATELLAR